MRSGCSAIAMHFPCLSVTASPGCGLRIRTARCTSSPSDRAALLTQQESKLGIGSEISISDQQLPASLALLGRTLNYHLRDAAGLGSYGSRSSRSCKRARWPGFWDRVGESRLSLHHLHRVKSRHRDGRDVGFLPLLAGRDRRAAVPKYHPNRDNEWHLDGRFLCGTALPIRSHGLVSALLAALIRAQTRSEPEGESCCEGHA